MDRCEAACDVCGNLVTSPNGYLLTTTQVVQSPPFWRHYYDTHGPDLTSLGIVTYDIFCDHPLVMAAIAQMIIRQARSWLVCENCVGMFSVDCGLAGQLAQKWWQSDRKCGCPDEGMAPSGAIHMRETDAA